MNPMLNYGIQVIIVSGLLYSYYHFVLRNKKFHRYNRFYLIGAALLSVLIPLLNIPVYFSEAATESSFVYNTLRVFSTNETNEGVTIYAGFPEKESWFTSTRIFQVLYITVATLVLLRIIFSLLKIRRMIRRHPVEKIENIHFLNTDEPGTPFSFFRWLFWNRKIELNSEKGEQIFRHELFHIEQKHSLDIIFLELLTVAGWFNPFFHLMKRETKAIHEFLADQFAVTENNRWDYAELLLMQVLNTNQRLVHPFFHTQIKRRIAMITSPQKTSHQYLRKLMVLPLTILSIFLFAFSYKEVRKEAKLTPVPEQKISADTTIKPIRNISVINKITLISDSIIFRSAPPQDPKNNIPEAIVFMNGKRISKNDYAKKTILCDSFEYYGADDKKAIELYGPDARAGVMIIHNGKITTDTTFVIKEANKPEADKIFSKVEIEASFPGGNDAWRKYLERNLDGQVPVKNKAPKGVYTVIVQFVVMADGNISDLRALTHHGFGMEEEAIKVIKKGLRWAPAIQNGRQVNAYRKQPVTFVVDNGAKIEGASAAGDGKMLPEVVMVGYSDHPATAEPDNKIFEKVETEPGFPGGNDKWREYLQKNCKSTVATDSGAPDGKYTILVQFIVDKEGNISDIRPLTKHGYGMEAEVVRVIENGPKWIPAVQNGKKVRAYKKQPVTFVVSDGDNEPVESKKGAVPEIAMSKLKTLTVTEALGLPAGTEVISFNFTIDLENGEFIEIRNSGNTFNKATKQQFTNAKPGKLMTFDFIKIRVNGEEMKSASRVYKVVP